MKFAPALLALLLLLSPPAAACDFAPVRPAIHVTTAETPARFDVSRSIAELSTIDIAKAPPYASHYHTEVGGVMSGAVTVEHRMEFRTRQGERASDTCLMLAEIGVRISIDPTIYIAREFRDQACWFREIFAHEAKHVAVDRELIEEYRARFTDALSFVLMVPGDYLVTDIPPGGIEQAQQQMQASIEDAMGVMFTRMMQERAERQQAVDSHGEYARISRACQGASS